MTKRSELHAPGTLGERASDRLASLVGSWKFILGQTGFICVWIVLNTVAFVYHWDPYPWILLNLCMSTQAMYTGPIVMLSQNRQAQKDRARDDLEATEVDEIHEGLELLKQINQQQLEILQKLDK